MKSVTRVHIWWQVIDKNIEEVVRNCLPCQSIRNKPPLTPLHSWSWRSQPWYCLHLDIPGSYLSDGSRCILKMVRGGTHELQNCRENNDRNQETFVIHELPDYQLKL